MLQWLLAHSFAVALFTAGAIQADDALPVTADPAADLVKALQLWDHRKAGGFVNTIPFEKAVLRAAAQADAATLVGSVAHADYGTLLFVALCERHPKGPAAGKLVEAFAAMDPDHRLECAVAVAALRTDGARAELRNLAAVDAFLASGPPRDLIRAALVRAGDPAAVAEVKKGLESKDAGEVATALLEIGTGHASEFLADVARLAADARKLATPALSQWPETRTTKSADGQSTTTETVPVKLATVGEVAVESASRVFATTLPPQVSWWYELEKGSRFGRDADAVKRLHQFVAADAKAAGAKGPSAQTAIVAVQAALRPKAEEMATWTFISAAFDRTWTISYKMGEAAGSATVDAAGQVTLH